MTIRQQLDNLNNRIKTAREQGDKVTVDRLTSELQNLLEGDTWVFSDR